MAENSLVVAIFLIKGWAYQDQHPCPSLKIKAFSKKLALKREREKRNCSAQACSAQVLHKLGNFNNKISEMLYLQYSEHLSLLMLAPGWLSGHTGKWPDLGRLKPHKRWVLLVWTMLMWQKAKLSFHSAFPSSERHEDLRCSGLNRQAWVLFWWELT